MEVASPLSAEIIDLASIAIALVSILAAAFIDLRSSRIPNWLTFAMILAGAAFLSWRCLYGHPLIDALLTCVISYAFVYAFWKLGLWGGGDAKAVLGISLLVSPLFYPLMFLAIYLACLSVALFVRHYIGGALSALAGLKLKTAALAFVPIPCSALVFILTLGQGPVPALALGLIVLALLADLISGTMPYSEKIDLLRGDAAGRTLMERIYLVDGAVVREKIRPGMIFGLIGRLNGSRGRPLVERSHGGLSCEDISVLKRYVDEVEVAIQRPMGPLLAIAFAMAMLVGPQLSQGGIT
jgi:Flp pilus assembly protein protease CpaA